MTGPRLVLDRFIPYRLSLASNAVSERIARAYAALFGLSIPEWRVIAVVAEVGETTQAALCEVTRMDKVTVSRAAIALAERGLIRRHANARDRRSRLIALTAAGGVLHAEVAPKALELEERIFAGFDADARSGLLGLLRRIEAAALAPDEGPPATP